MSFDLQLAGRRALVTGGSRGVGKAVCEALHNAGAKVVAAARSAPAELPEGIHFIEADLGTAAG
jgi:NAD(P)-dependent dehydrogenase (short-subunit alcohol dehydrogenase family)